MRGVVDCNVWKTEKLHECRNMGKVKRLKLWWQLYVMWLPVRDFKNLRAMGFCSFECTTCKWYGLNSKRGLNKRQTVCCHIPSSLLTLWVHLCGLCSKLSWIRLTFSSHTRSWPELLPLHRQPICSNWWFQWQMLFLIGGWMLKRRRNARCTAVADWVLMNSRTQKIFGCIVAILLSTDAAAWLCTR